MQPSEPLSPGETYYDKDLGIEVVAAESSSCTFPSHSTVLHKAERISCVYRDNCKTVKSCITPHHQSGIVYLPKLQYATFKLTQLVI